MKMNNNSNNETCNYKENLYKSALRISLKNPKYILSDIWKDMVILTFILTMFIIYLVSIVFFYSGILYFITVVYYNLKFATKMVAVGTGTLIIAAGGAVWLISSRYKRYIHRYLQNIAKIKYDRRNEFANNR